MIVQSNEIKIKADYLEEKHRIIAQEKHWENSYAGELRKYFMLFNMECNWIPKNLNFFAVMSQTLDFSHSKGFAIIYPTSDITTANVWQGDSIIFFYGASSGVHHLFNEHS